MDHCITGAKTQVSFICGIFKRKQDADALFNAKWGNA